MNISLFLSGTLSIFLIALTFAEFKNAQPIEEDKKEVEQTFTFNEIIDKLNNKQ